MPLSDIAWAVEDLNARAPGIRKRQRYQRGLHDEVIPKGGKDLSPLMKRLVRELNDNLCDDVVSEPVDRLSILGWSGKRNGIGTIAEEQWEQSRGDARFREVLEDMLCTGDGWTIAEEFDNGAVRWFRQDPLWMAARYSSELPDQIEVAAKVWREGKQWRMNLYYPPEPGINSPRVERFITKGSNSDGSVPGPRSFAPMAPDEATGKGPVDTLDFDRIPVFHYPNDTVAGYGEPLLSDTIMGLQDVLNKSVVDMVVHSEATALPDRWATGIQDQIDPLTGASIPLKKSGNDRMLRTGSDKAQFGQFSLGSSESFLSSQTGLRAEIARKGKLPPWSVEGSGGNAPSGLALLIGEGRMVKMCLRIQDAAGTILRSQQAFTLTVAGTPTEPVDLEINWAPPATRDIKALLEELSLKVDLGLPKREALIEAGYDEDDVDGWLEEAEAQRLSISGGRVSPATSSPFLPSPAGQNGLQDAPMAPAGASQPTA